MKKTIDIFLDVEYNKKELPERGLFLSVILQALLDATNKKSKVHRDKAIAWFFCSVGVTCDNFEQICNHAGLYEFNRMRFSSRGITRAKSRV